MLRSRLGLVAAAALTMGTAGCSLPEVLPLAGGTTQGPSPYGVWYEQHWATNAVLLAAADGTEEQTPVDGGGEAAGATFDDEAPIDGEASAEELGANGIEPENLQPDAKGASRTTVEASAATGSRARDFDNSTPYQFPASAYSGNPQRSSEIPNDDMVPVAPKASEPAGSKAAPPSGGPIRY